MENLRHTAEHIADYLKHCGFDDITDSSGYYIIKEFEDGEYRAVDVHKASDNGSLYYVIYCSYEDDDFDYKYTDELSVEQLEEKLREFYMA